MGQHGTGVPGGVIRVGVGYKTKFSAATGIQPQVQLREVYTSVKPYFQPFSRLGNSLTSTSGLLDEANPSKYIIGGVA